jgi:hypothetical protein
MCDSLHFQIAYWAKLKINKNSTLENTSKVAYEEISHLGATGGGKNTGEKWKQADKPGSVESSHSSGPAVTRRL